MNVIATENRELIILNTQNTQNENKVETIAIQVPEQYEDFNKKIVFVTPEGVFWDLIENNEYVITRRITQYESVTFYIWLTKDDVDFRTKERKLKFNLNHKVDGEITPEEQSGMERVIAILEAEISEVNAKEDELTTLINTIQTKLDNGEFNGRDGINGVDGQDGQPGQKGEDGIDGISPTITETQTQNGYDITITDKNGSNTISLLNGKDGKDGTNGQDGAKGEKRRQRRQRR